MEEITYIVEVIEPFIIDRRFGKPFYDFSIDIIKIKNNVSEEEECQSIFYDG